MADRISLSMKVKVADIYLLHFAMLNILEILLLVDGKEKALLVLEERF